MGEYRDLKRHGLGFSKKLSTLLESLQDPRNKDSSKSGSIHLRCRVGVSKSRRC